MAEKGGEKEKGESEAVVPSSVSSTLTRQRIRVQVLFAKMKVALWKTVANVWTFKNIFYFVGSVAVMHFYGDELAV